MLWSSLASRDSRPIRSSHAKRMIVADQSIAHQLTPVSATLTPRTSVFRSPVSRLTSRQNRATVPRRVTSGPLPPIPKQ